MFPAYHEPPTPDELPDELDAPLPAPTVKVNGWSYPADPCRSPGCPNLVPHGTGRMCTPCDDLYRDQVRA